ncbi:hypothetical protein EA716_03090 [Acinetobacter baumannii]|uniref:hypothetical protein n=1 Tax=Acinetobacter baumannii TaxID=470 RepID=UPI000F743150|nr:hypothetical protein [Acinetobacter baumannii]RSP97789.1 hypothetical protein EA716_03090 [Acinetobacter baumannii]
MFVSTEERNIAAKNYVLDLYSLIKDLSIEDFIGNELFKIANPILENLISVQIKAKGFRGVVLTAIVGKKLNPDYDFLNDFYSCNPRSIFEQGIFLALRELKIPSGKSDPLNVAKNTFVLDPNWAEGKRPQKAAEAVINYLKLLDKFYKNTEEYEYLVKLFMFRLKELSDHHSKLMITPVTTTGDTQQELANKLWGFISQAVEGGTIPQFFIGILLEAIYLHDKRIYIEGTRESVSGTNTTSKKPGDLILLRDDKPISILEITLKNIDTKRLSDSYDVLNELNFLNIPITFICRLPEDTKTLKNIIYNSKISSGFIKNPHYFNFLDMESFICSQIALLDSMQTDYLLTNLREFINLYDRPLSTKNIWNTCFPPLSEEN